MAGVVNWPTDMQRVIALMIEHDGRKTVSNGRKL